MTDQLTTTEKIIAALDELQEIHGIEHLTYEVLGNSRKSFVRCKLRQLEAAGECEYITNPNGGRGHKSIIRRRNRNSPGAPRRDDRKGRQVP